MNEHPTEHRNELIATALAELEAPEHEPDFFERLEALITEEELRRRGYRRGRALLRGRRIQWALRIGIAAAVAAVLVLMFALPRLAGPEEASAAEIKERVRSALAEAKTMRGRIRYRAFDVRTGNFTTSRFSFAASAHGDFRLEQLGGPSDLAYDASTGVERSINTSASIGAGQFYAERRGLAPGPPDQGPSDSLLARQLGATVRALLAAHDPRVSETVYQERKGWRLVFPIRPNAVFADVDRLDVTVDQKTALPVRVIATLEGSVRSELEIDDLAVDTKLAADTFAVAFPAHADVLRTDEGFRRRALGQVAAGVGYAPLVPHWVPGGYRLAQVALARSTEATAGGLNPPSRMVVSLAYRRGFDQFTVTTRLRNAGRSWRDPFAIQGVRFHSTTVRLTHNALAGSEARLVLDSRTIPHIWALTGDLVVTVSGDLTRAELLDVTGSLVRETRS
jgi:outer membrane lipoprotein-sorting protein